MMPTKSKVGSISSRWSTISSTLSRHIKAARYGLILTTWLFIVVRWIIPIQHHGYYAPTSWSTYLMSLGVVSFSPGKPPIKLSNLNMIGVIMWEPDATQAAVNLTYGDGSSYPYDPPSDYGVSRLHLPGCNLLFSDAHVEFKKYDIGMAECMDTINKTNSGGIRQPQMDIEGAYAFKTKH